MTGWIEQRVLETLIVMLFPLLGSCTHGWTPGVQPDVRRLPYDDHEIETGSEVGDAEAISLADRLSMHGVRLLAVWPVPDVPQTVLVIIEKAATEESYGPQLAVMRGHAGAAEIVHESRRLFDDDFINPTFVAFPGHTLLLADHGSEDAYGMIAWSFQDGRVRDLGELEVALPEESDVFTRGAARTARVGLRNGVYVVRIPGPLLLYPQQERERLLARRGEVATFHEIDGKFELVR